MYDITQYLSFIQGVKIANIHRYSIFSQRRRKNKYKGRLYRLFYYND